MLSSSTLRQIPLSHVTISNSSILLKFIPLKRITSLNHKSPSLNQFINRNFSTSILIKSTSNVPFNPQKQKQLSFSTNSQINERYHQIPSNNLPLIDIRSIEMSKYFGAACIIGGGIALMHVFTIFKFPLTILGGYMLWKEYKRRKRVGKWEDLWRESRDILMRDASLKIINRELGPKHHIDFPTSVEETIFNRLSDKEGGYRWGSRVFSEDGSKVGWLFTEAHYDYSIAKLPLTITKVYLELGSVNNSTDPNRRVFLYNYNLPPRGNHYSSFHNQWQSQWQHGHKSHVEVIDPEISYPKHQYQNQHKQRVDIPIQ